jgi:hypothetical protein
VAVSGNSVKSALGNVQMQRRLRVNVDQPILLACDDSTGIFKSEY